MGLVWSAMTTTYWMYAILWLIAAIAPLVHAWIKRTPMALGIGISLMLTWLIQAFVEWQVNYDLMMWLGALLPAWALEPSEFHRFVTAAWLHADTLHILGNLIVIILVGVPLEQRLGRGRFLVIYIIGVLGGNIGWTLANWGSTGFSLGASGAAFGLLGCYLACWPGDEIEFPIILIRKWPVSFIALLKLGLEIIQYGILTNSSTMSDNVAHLAHITGFIACYVLAKPIAKGGLAAIGTVDSGPSSIGSQEAIEASIKSRMGTLSSDPWADAGTPLEGPPARTLNRLRAEGDEPETRQAWLEELAEQTTCPICGDLIFAEVRDGVTVLNSSTTSSHLDWP